MKLDEDSLTDFSKTLAMAAVASTYGKSECTKLKSERQCAYNTIPILDFQEVQSDYDIHDLNKDRELLAAVKRLNLNYLVHVLRAPKYDLLPYCKTSSRKTENSLHKVAYNRPVEQNLYSTKEEYDGSMNFDYLDANKKN